MTDFSSLKIKVNDLKAKVAQNSITPAYLGALLDDFITQMQVIDLTDLSEDLSKAIKDATSALSQSKSALEKADASTSVADSALSKSLSALESIQSLVSSIGAPLGIAALDSDGLVPERHMPPGVFDVLSFAGEVNHSSPTIVDKVCTQFGVVKLHKGRFVFSPVTISNPGTSAGGIISSGDDSVLYTAWSTRYLPLDGGADVLVPESPRYGSPSAQGVKPYADRLYINSAEANRPYYWDGSAMVPVCSGLSLGHTEGTAFPGDEGHVAASRAHAAAICPFDGFSYPSEEAAVERVAPKGLYFTPANGGPAYFGSPKAVPVGFTIEDYNTYDSDGNLTGVRTDRLFRCGSRLYRFDEMTGDLREYGPDIPQMFIDGWCDAAGTRGGYDRFSRRFSLNGLHDIEYTEAMRIYECRSHLPVMIPVRSGIRTNMLVDDGTTPSYDVEYSALEPCVLSDLLNGSSDIRILYVGTDKAFPIGVTVISAIPVIGRRNDYPQGYGTKIFAPGGDTHPLHTILGWIEPRQAIDWNAGSLCEISLANLSYDQDFSRCAGLSLGSVKRMVNRAPGLSPVTISVHADVYNRLAGLDTALDGPTREEWVKIRKKAESKQISFILA